MEQIQWNFRKLCEWQENVSVLVQILEKKQLCKSQLARSFILEVPSLSKKK